MLKIIFSRMSAGHKVVRMVKEKCNVMHIGHEYTTTYVMEDGGRLRNLDSIEIEKDLGIHVTRDI